jgi:type IV pilus assembly protein PilP
MAVQEYHLRHNKFPDKLTTLVPEFLSEVPKNPKTQDEFYFVVSGDSYHVALSEKEAYVFKNGPNTPYVDPDLAGIPDIQAIKVTFVYDSASKRDPFLPIGYEATQKKKNCKEPLTCFDTSQLKIVSVIDSNGQKRAMIETPEGKGYSVGVGSHVGYNDGEVVDIQDTKVIILEESKDIVGNLSHNKIELTLREKELESDEKSDDGVIRN